MSGEKLPYGAEHVIVRDFGLQVEAVWTGDPDLEAQLRHGDEATYRRLMLTPANEIEPIASISRVYKYEGYTESGWLIGGNGYNAGREYAATTKVEAMKMLRQAVTDYFIPRSAR